jgi:hypothetical protein
VREVVTVDDVTQPGHVVLGCEPDLQEQAERGRKE